MERKHPDLPSDRELAYGRLKSCLKKLHSKPELLKKYNAVIQDQIEKGVIEKANHEVSVGLQHYIPHHAVVKLQKTNTKVRIVYDASAKITKDHRCLNECLYMGPVILNDMYGLLMRFHLHKIGLVSDIERLSYKLVCNQMNEMLRDSSGSRTLQTQKRTLTI